VQAGGLVLRIEGTAFAYRPRPEQTVITLGRQKRKLGAPDDTGNDVVLRIPGNDPLSACISRRHLEIRLTTQGYVVLDLSKAGTLHNGRSMSPGVPEPLQVGDLLVVAGVITLEVLPSDTPLFPIAPRPIEVPAAGNRMAPIVFEASVGDVATVE
jgi:hypothetical protein